MKSTIISKYQIQQVVSDNKYKIDPKTKLQSRCIDDRYQDDLNLSPLALPGADAGELALLYATANNFGFEIIGEKAYQVLTEMLGGVQNLHFHTDTKSVDDPMGGCGHFKQMILNPKAYHLEPGQIDFIKIKIANSIALGARDTVLTGEHVMGAVLLLEGGYNIYPNYALESNSGTHRVQFFEYHETLVKERHKVLADKLVEQQAVKLFAGCDAEYLFEAISDMTDEHFYETVKRLGKGLPIYRISFDKDGGFTIDEMERV